MNSTPSQHLAREVSGDFYLEGGFVIFTEAYLTKRGYCCGSGCRHCPYKKGTDTGSLLPESPLKP